MILQSVNIENIPHPEFVYSQAILAEKLVFIAGQPGIDFNTGIVSGSFESQARQAFYNLSLVLEASGSKLDKIVKTTIWLTDASNFGQLNELYAEYFPNNPPARSTPIVGLPMPNLLISIEAIAIVE